MIIKQVIHYPDSNSIEVTWVDAVGKQVRCHSYSDAQMEMLIADLGSHAAEYAGLISVAAASVKPTSPETPPKISQVTMRQARLALLGAGLLSQVDAAIQSLPEPAKTAAKIDWEYAAVVHRSSGLVPAMGVALGMTDVQIDALFTLADTL